MCKFHPLDTCCMVQSSLAPAPPGPSYQIHKRTRFIVVSSRWATVQMIVAIVSSLLFVSCLSLQASQTQTNPSVQTTRLESYNGRLSRRSLESSWLSNNYNLFAADSGTSFDSASNTPSNLKQAIGSNASIPKGCPVVEANEQDLTTNRAIAQDRKFFNEFVANRTFGYTEEVASDFVKPTFYTLRLKLDPTRKRFTGQLMIGVDILASGESGKDSHRYITLHAGANLQIKKAFYVYTSNGGVQIPATKLGRDGQRELLTMDFHPNVITTPGQGLLLIVYSGFVNETNSHGLFVHRMHRSSKKSSSSSAPPSSNQSDDFGLATQLQPSFARRLFPCWDEPDMKARFSLIVVLPFRNYQVISNMPMKRKALSISCSGDPLQEIEFHTTPLMSTYLLALVVGHFDHIESITQSNCKISAYFYANHSTAPLSSNQQDSPVSSNDPSWHPTISAAPVVVNSRKQAAQMALDVAVKTFDKFESLLGIKYPLTKFDMIALREFESGGMENWGASIFHERYLLYDAGASNQPSGIQLNGGQSRPRRVVVPLVVAHEIAHQWFGNLLTSKSWTYLWLNEGFAQMLMYEAADSLFPHENYWHIFIEDSRHSAMISDELLTTSRALEFESANASSADQMSWFDQITYNKGAMIVKLLQSFMGRDEFFSGLHHYLHKHSYGTVVSQDLWQALEESGKTNSQIASIMSSWLHLEGYPLISVQVQELPAHYKLHVYQERFTLYGLPGQPLTSSDSEWSSWTWSIPVTVRGGSGANSTAKFFLSNKEAIIMLPKAQLGTSWFKLNSDSFGYYRVDYQIPLNADGSMRTQSVGSTNLYDRMAVAIKNRSMSVLDRFNVVDDLFALVRAGRKPTAFYLRYISSTFDQEDEVIVARKILDSLKRIKEIISNADERVGLLYDKFVRDYLSRLTQSLGDSSRRRRQSIDMSDDSSRKSTARIKELEDLIEFHRMIFNEQEVTSRSLRLFRAYFTNNQLKPDMHHPFESMDRDMKGLVYSNALLDASVSNSDLDTDYNLILRHNSSMMSATSGGDPIGGAPSLIAEVIAMNGSSSVAESGSFTNNKDDMFLKLLEAYESSESSGERYAISAALGSISLPNKRSKLLNLTFNENYFRPQDVGPLLESMARTKDGRLLIFEALKRNTKLIEQRQVLHLFLKSLTGGLIEPRQEEQEMISTTSANSTQTRAPSESQPTTTSPSMTTTTTNGRLAAMAGQVESELRALYKTSYGLVHGKLILETIELILVNSNWFYRDISGVTQYLESL